MQNMLNGFETNRCPNPRPKQPTHPWKVTFEKTVRSMFEVLTWFLDGLGWPWASSVSMLLSIYVFLANDIWCIANTPLEVMMAYLSGARNVTLDDCIPCLGEEIPRSFQGLLTSLGVNTRHWRDDIYIVRDETRWDERWNTLGLGWFAAGVPCRCIRKRLNAVVEGMVYLPLSIHDIEGNTLPRTWGNRWKNMSL